MPLTRPLLHPLAGNLPADLVRTLAAHGGPSLGHVGQTGLIGLCSLLNAPFAWIEMARTRAAATAPLDPPPLFIVGHWRSGTTLLHNLLSRDPRFCFPTITDALRPHSFYPSPVEWISRAMLLRTMPQARPMDGLRLRQDLPQEDELALAAMGAPSFLNCLYFPRRMQRTFAEQVLFEGAPQHALTAWRSCLTYYFGKLTRLAPGRRLLVKNPAHSARIDELRRLFPGAQFIHLSRDPIEVLASTRKLYRTMLPLVALQPYDMPQVEDHIVRAYGRLVDRLRAGLSGVAPADWIALAYADLVAAPRDAVCRIYGHFGLTGFESAWPTMQRLLEGERPNTGLTDTVDWEFAHRHYQAAAA